MSVFAKAYYDLINLGVCIKAQADRLGIEHEGMPLEGVVVRIAARALAEQGETEWEYIAQFGHVRGEERITAEAAIQSAREVLDDYPLDFPESELPMQVLRRPLVGWLPVPDTTNKGSEGTA